MPRWIDESVTSSTRCPGRPVMELASVPPEATTLAMAMLRSTPGWGSVMPRPRFPRRTKIGVRAFSIVTLLIAMFSTTAPSTVSSAIPAMAGRPRSRDRITRLETVMWRNPPRLSVPSLK
jgi:hypothetical protein